MPTDAAGQAFLAQKAREPGVISRPSGLLYEYIERGYGNANPLGDTPCDFHYRGTLINGKEFDSSYKRGKPSEFTANGVVPGCSEGYQLMVEGDKVIMYIPSELAYGDQGVGGDLVPPCQVLVFEVHLVKIKGPTKPAGPQLLQQMQPQTLAQPEAVMQATGMMPPSVQQQQLTATVLQTIGKWSICEDAQGQFYFDTSTNQSYDQPPPELLALMGQAQSYAQPPSHVPPQAYAHQAGAATQATGMMPPSVPQQQPTARVVQTIGKWSICEDAQGQFYLDTSTNQSYDQPPPELLALVGQGQSYAQPQSHVPPQAYAQHPEAVTQASGMMPPSMPQQQQPTATVLQTIGKWSICEDAQGQFYVDTSTNQSYNQPPPELLALMGQAQSYAQPQSYVPPQAYAQSPYAPAQVVVQPQVHAQPGGHAVAQQQAYAQPQTHAQTYSYSPAQATMQPQAYSQPQCAQPRTYAQPQACAQPQFYTQPQVSAQPQVFVQHQAYAQPQSYAAPQTYVQPQVCAQPQAFAQPQMMPHYHVG